MVSHYPYYVDPKVYPDYERRPVKVPTWETFDGMPRFTVLRGFQEEGEQVLNPEWNSDLDLYTRRFGLGTIIWPVIHTMFADNFKELVEEAKKRRLFLFDFWGHVPGSGMEGMWSHVIPPEGLAEYMEEELGDHFLGVDNGEQDGRYIGGYAGQQCPCFQDRFRQYLNFQRHFQELCDDLGNHMSALVSLCYGHYFVKEGNHVLLGAETAQALPNSQIYYAFIRGACKQYGIHWFGNASVFNRWGYKSYQSEGDEESGNVEKTYGPEEGTSLNLLKRLLYTHYLYNCVFMGFENGWLDRALKTKEDREQVALSPIGKIQAEAVKFVRKHGRPGVMHTPVALLLDHYAGWAPPRHLYTRNVYQVWGGMPYGPGDYLTHGVLSLLYPGYEDASYYRDERGFLSPTPYGDIADVLLSDAPLWVLKRYGLVIISGHLTMDMELKDKLRKYMESGGHVIVTGANAAGLIPGVCIRAEKRSFSPGTVVYWAGSGDEQQLTEDWGFELLQLEGLEEGTRVLAECRGLPAAVQVDFGKGRCTVLLTPFGLNSDPLVKGPVQNTDHHPLACPYVLLKHVRCIMGEALQEQQLFSVSKGLSLITCRKGQGKYILGVHNNDLHVRPLQIKSHCGSIQSITEMPLDQSEKGATGYWPKGHRDNDGGISDDRNIAGGDIRLFQVTVDEDSVKCLPQVPPPGRPHNRMLSLRSQVSIQEQILARPTFFQHFDGVKVDWRYLQTRDRAELKRSADWLARQQVRVVVDFSSGLNFYPDLTILDTLLWRYKKSMRMIEDVLEKMSLLDAKNAVISLHRKPENHCSPARANDRFSGTVQTLCRRAQAQGITFHLQHHPNKWHGSARDMLEFIEAVNMNNLRFAVNTAHVSLTGERLEDVLLTAAGRLGLFLLSAPGKDLLDQQYDSHAPVNGAGLDLSILQEYDHIPQILDANYSGWDEEYMDCVAVWG